MSNKILNNPKKNIILVGCGPHAKRIYLPCIKKFSKKMNFNLSLIVDLKINENKVKKFLKKINLKADLLFIENCDMSFKKLNKKIKKYLENYITQNDISGVLISSEPLTHLMYASWALKNGLHILADKPLSTYQNISTKESLGAKTLQDFILLNNLYTKAKQKNKDISFTVMSQRRFHPAYQRIKELIKECFDKTNCPITSIQSFHSDGQWRMPSEIVNQLYHPYMQGYGKCSHSGYHFFDLIPHFLESCTNNEKSYDNLEIVSNFVRPNDFYKQLNFNDYYKIFGKKKFTKYSIMSEDEISKLSKKFGEIDAFNNIIFKKGNNIITIASLNLIHNGFGQRHWLSNKGKDLYKGNGRIRHESHIIEQGPFQSIHFHSYQSYEVDPKRTKNIFKIGGEKHIDIYIFRNIMIFDKEFEIINIKELNENILKKRSRGHQEDARVKGFIEFIERMQSIKKSDFTSDLTSHFMSSVIFSGVYRSGAKQFHNKPNRIKINLLKYKNQLKKPLKENDKKTKV